MGRSKKGRCVKKNKQVDSAEPETIVRAPHSFVIHRGLPASALKERKKNSIKDFVSVAGVLHVSHMCIFSRTDVGMYLKLGRLPRGPTLTFKIHNFTLSRDVISSSKKQMVFDEIFKHSPLVVLNNFSGEGMHMKLMASTFQNMFPTINLRTVNLNTIRRCVCLNYNAETKSIDLRHYAIKVVPLGLSKGVKKLVQAKIPNLSSCQNYEDFLTKTPVSDSEAEDDPSNSVVLPHKLSSRGNLQDNNSAIKLYELGPRLSLQLMKIEEGLLDGVVLFHEVVHKTEEEKLKIEKIREQKRRIKEARKKLQRENKQAKEKAREEHRAKSKRRSDVERVDLDKERAQEAEDDAQYYREEVGEEPDKDLFQVQSGKRKSFGGREKFKKKFKTK
ncbi:protein Peter pan isoform X2 [Fopius arisanus]|uniref:Protein Peter pan isoform X2 n=1 Tax=Fopius arisanus TaxID=64838 RepID=A0A9R1TIN3_9HYME|nr:PREDICTED: protein Peter pan isoform X2 [Fopius arisanus]